MSAIILSSCLVTHCHLINVQAEYHQYKHVQKPTTVSGQHLFLGHLGQQIATALVGIALGEFQVKAKEVDIGFNKVKDIRGG